MCVCHNLIWLLPWSSLPGLNFTFLSTFSSSLPLDALKTIHTQAVLMTSSAIKAIEVVMICTVAWRIGAVNLNVLKNGGRKCISLEERPKISQEIFIDHLLLYIKYQCHLI